MGTFIVSQTARRRIWHETQIRGRRVGGYFGKFLIDKGDWEIRIQWSNQGGSSGSPSHSHPRPLSLMTGIQPYPETLGNSWGNATFCHWNLFADSAIITPLIRSPINLWLCLYRPLCTHRRCCPFTILWLSAFSPRRMPIKNNSNRIIRKLLIAPIHSQRETENLLSFLGTAPLSSSLDHIVPAPHSYPKVKWLGRPDPSPAQLGPNEISR